MNKWQIICPTAAAALVGLFMMPTAVKRYKMYRDDSITYTARCAAWDLEQQTNSTLLVSITPELKTTLAAFLTTPGAYRDTFRFGDDPAPAGDGTATYRIYIRNFDDDCIALRLKHDPQLKKFHILGFRHPAVWPDPPH
jgi:hypothetical protein